MNGTPPSSSGPSSGAPPGRRARLVDPEDFLAELSALFVGLNDGDALALAARVILLLSNEIGDRELLRELFAAAIVERRAEEEFQS